MMRNFIVALPLYRECDKKSSPTAVASVCRFFDHLWVIADGIKRLKEKGSVLHRERQRQDNSAELSRCPLQLDKRWDYLQSSVCRGGFCKLRDCYRLTVV